jgi:DNA topoisomerase-1
MQDAREAGLKYVTLDDPGFTRHRQGRGFLYQNSKGSVIKDADTLARIKELVIPPAWESVWICENPRGHLQVSGIDAKGRRQYLYHPAYREQRDFNKFNHVIAFGSALPRIRRAVSRDLARPGLPKRKVLALAVRLLDRTSMRIGSNEYARKNGSYGLTTLKNEHVRIRGSEVRFRFRAKSGVEQTICLKDTELAKMLDETRKLRGEDLFQYRDEDGEAHGIQPGDVNDYLREIAGEKLTAKEFRTWHGTVQMLMELFQAGPAAGPTDAKRRLAAAHRELPQPLLVQGGGDHGPTNAAAMRIGVARFSASSSPAVAKEKGLQFTLQPSFKRGLVAGPPIFSSM